MRCALKGLLAAGMAASFATPASASDYGCRVLLCLANPAGPTAIAQCVPPITQLWQDLTRLRPFPSCDEARPARAVQNTTWYDECPTGTAALERGAFAFQQGSPDASPAQGIGTGDDLAPDPVNGIYLSQKVCVGSQVGQSMAWIGDLDSGYQAWIPVYDRVVVFDPATSPRVIDVYLNSALYRRVRW